MQYQMDLEAACKAAVLGFDSRLYLWKVARSGTQHALKAWPRSLGGSTPLLSSSLKRRKAIGKL